jgi:hypothetical protein
MEYIYMYINTKLNSISGAVAVGQYMYYQYHIGGHHHQNNTLRPPLR